MLLPVRFVLLSYWLILALIASVRVLLLIKLVRHKLLLLLLRLIWIFSANQLPHILLLLKTIRCSLLTILLHLIVVIPWIWFGLP
jgi:hypothetical protein